MVTDLVLAGYAYSALICFTASCVMIGTGKKGAAAVVIVLSNAVITFMLIYGAMHT